MTQARTVTMWRDLRQQLRVRGLQGPAYGGLLGKLRLGWEHFVIRIEVVSVATPDSVPEQTGSEREPIRLRFIRTFQELEPYHAVFNTSYYGGFTTRWEAPFTWGETLILGLVNDVPVAFTWIQRGSAGGIWCHYGPLLPHEARLLRAGVFPTCRRRGTYTGFNRAVLRHLFAEGARRVYIDCYRANTPALKAQIRAGFRPIGLLQVVPGFQQGRPFIRWREFPRTFPES